MSTKADSATIAANTLFERLKLLRPNAKCDREFRRAYDDLVELFAATVELLRLAEPE